MIQYINNVIIWQGSKDFVNEFVQFWNSNIFTITFILVKKLPTQLLKSRDGASLVHPFLPLVQSVLDVSLRHSRGTWSCKRQDVQYKKYCCLEQSREEGLSPFFHFFLLPFTCTCQKKNEFVWPVINNVKDGWSYEISDFITYSTICGLLSYLPLWLFVYW